MITKGQESNATIEYKVVPPDGGWGYIVAIATTISTCAPVAAFGLIYGKFLDSVGDETTGTTLATGFFNTVSSFMGLATNILLNRYSYRQVALAGSAIFIIGAVNVIFSKTMIQFLLFYGVVQGIGFGLLMPSSFSAMNCYFDNKLSVMMSLSQTFLIAAYMSAPPLATISIEYLGFKGTLILIANLSVLSFPSALSFRPAQSNIGKISIDTFELNNGPAIGKINLRQRALSLGNEMLYSQMQPLVNTNMNKANYPSEKFVNRKLSRDVEVYIRKPRMSVVSLGDRSAAIPIDSILENLEDKSFCKSLLESMDMSLLKNLQYLNVSIGVALSYTADVSFFPIIPLILTNIGYSSSDIALAISIYFGSDLAARLIFSVVSGLVEFNSRHVLLMGSFLSAIFRFVFVGSDSYILKITSLVILGSMRCTVQTVMPLVFSEQYPDIFATAFSLFMVVNGTIGLVTAPLMSYIKSWTDSDLLVCHILTIMYLICVVSWLLEMWYYRLKEKRGTT
ncbi:monocarboxylate transporter 9-like isoform X2 [Cylas formicarius]|uniref:monocarboxylate transporter 9-like isoform X2 n=1 Tax=Cylas formicarius TaxID=197179 RepID=UPI0029585074|nr:monocarboxylate transporter 9-like isoform X2 [Cylas formicarius]